MSRIAMIVWNEFLNDARVLKEAQTLQHGGHRVTVFALHTPGITQQRETLQSGIEVVRVSRRPMWTVLRHKPVAGAKAGYTEDAPTKRLSPARQLLRIVARLWTHGCLLARIAVHRADVVHAHDVNTLPTAWLAAKFSGARVVYDAHEISTSREGYSNLRGPVAWVEKTLMPRVQGTITTTEARARFFARAYGIARPVVLQNRPRLTVSAVTRRIREELGFSETWPIVIYQGGLQQGRGLERLIQAASHVQGAYFVLVGGGRLTQPLMALVRHLGLSERVHFIPTVALAELPSYTASADIGVQPIENTCLNHFTTDSNKLFEYIIAGLPVVATDFPEIRQVVRLHDTGLLVRSGDEAGLIRALNTLVQDASLRLRLAGNSRMAAAQLNWEQQEDQLLQLYSRVLSGRPGRQRAV